MSCFSRGIGLVRNSVELFRIAHAAKNRPRRLLLITHELTASGSSILLSNLCRVYTDRGYAVVILTENQGPIAPPVQDAVDRACGLLRLSGRERIRLYFLKRLKELGFDLAIGNTVISGQFAPALRRAGIRSIFLIHEMMASLSILHMKKIAQELLDKDETLVFPASRVRDVFLRFAGVSGGPDNLLLLPQGCRLPQSGISLASAAQELRAWLKLPGNAAVVLGAGAINFGKGVDLCLLTLQKLLVAEVDRPYHLVWLGTVQQDDPYYQWLMVQIDVCGLSDRVHFAGFVRDVTAFGRILAGSDVFFLSSREDSFPSVVIEAMCMRLPVIAFEGSGGASEYLANKGTGVCVPMADADAASRAIRSICADRQRYANEKTEQRARSDFEFGSYADKLLALLEKSGDGR